MGEILSFVEVINLPRGVYMFTVRSAVPSLTGLDGRIVLPGLHVGLCPGANSRVG